jgi:ABC-type proline/glycine betaine transport system permease subunit
VIPTAIINSPRARALSWVAKLHRHLRISLRAALCAAVLAVVVGALVPAFAACSHVFQQQRADVFESIKDPELLAVILAVCQDRSIVPQEVGACVERVLECVVEQQARRRMPSPYP